MICHGHQLVVHVAAQFVDELDVKHFSQGLCQRLREVAFISEKLAEQLLDQARHWLAIIHITA